MKNTKDIKITEEENKELTADELKMIAGGDSLRDEYFNKSTELLKEAGEIVLAKMGDDNELWNLINTAEKTLSTSQRKEYIEKAWSSAIRYWYAGSLTYDEYDRILDKLTLSKINNNIAERYQ